MTRKKIQFSKSGLLQSGWSYLCIIMAAVLLAFNYQLFIVNNGFAPAGLNGIATMVQYKTGFSIGYMSLIINIPLCILAYFLVDKSFARRSLVFSLAYSLVFLLLQKIGLEQLCPKAEIISRELVDKFKAQGYSVRAWGVKNEELMRRVIDSGADGMTVNFPDKLTEALK